MTVGQAFGGDLEAVTVHSGLLAARLALGADLVVVSQGPGNLGHRDPVGLLRASAWARPSTPPPPWAAGRSARCGSRRPTPGPRHRGLSHHSVTAYGRVALLPADLAVPDLAAAGALDGIEGLDAVVALAPEVDAAVARAHPAPRGAGAARPAWTRP